MNAPTVSVLMTVYNAEPYLEASLASIAGQSFADCELVVVDDASTDGSLRILEDWSQRDSRIKVIPNQQNKGQTPCLNQGLRLCRGAWIARQDADDLSHPSRLERQLEYLQRHPGTVLLGTQGVLINEYSRRIGLLDVPCNAAAILWSAPFLNPFLHTSVIFRRDIVMGEFGGYDEGFRIAQDYDLWMRLAAMYPTANLEARLVSYRHLGSSLSKIGSSTAFEEASRISAREAGRVFSRSWNSEEQALVAAFRRGLRAGEVAAFHALRRRLEDEFVARHPGEHAGPASVKTAWKLKIAGSVAQESPFLGMREVASALIANPVGVLRWARERAANS